MEYKYVTSKQAGLKSVPFSNLFGTFRKKIKLGLKLNPFKLKFDSVTWP